MSIPEDPRNADWAEYLEWLAEGNVADPIAAPVPPSDEDQLQGSDQQMIRAVDWLLQHLVQKGVIQVADIPGALKQLYQERKALRGA